jgi:hypothetical protein
MSNHVTVFLLSWPPLPRIDAKAANAYLAEKMARRWQGSTEMHAWGRQPGMSLMEGEGIVLQPSPVCADIKQLTRNRLLDLLFQHFYLISFSGRDRLPPYGGDDTL